MDPLQLLRQYCIQKKPIPLDETHDVLQFAEGNVPFQTETVLRRRRGKGKPYTIGTLWFLLKHADLPHPKYLAEVHKKKYNFVALSDRNKFIRYFRGEVNSIPGIDIVASTIAAIPSTVATGTGSALSAPIPSVAPSQVDGEKSGVIPMVDGLPSLERDASSLAQGVVVPFEELEIGDDQSELAQAKTALSAFLDQDRGVREGYTWKGRMRTTEEEIKKKKVSDAVRPFVEVEAPLCREIIRRERTFEDRNSNLLCTGRDFSDIVAHMTDILRAAELRKQEGLKQKRNARISDAKKAAASAAKSEWDRSEAEHRAHVSGRKSRGLDASSRSQDSKRKRSSQSSSSASSRRRTSSIPKPERPLTSSGTRNLHPYGIPIIVVPNAMTSLISMYNARDFLVEGKFIPPMEKKAAGARRLTTLTIERRQPNGKAQKYEVISNPNVALKHKRDWRRVVCVFAQGPAWQFKGWAWSKPVEIFTYARGFHMNYVDAVIPDTIKSWNVKILPVERSTRHRDSTIAFSFWKELESFLQRRPTPP